MEMNDLRFNPYDYIKGCCNFNGRMVAYRREFDSYVIRKSI